MSDQHERNRVCVVVGRCTARAGEAIRLSAVGLYEEGETGGRWCGFVWGCSSGVVGALRWRVGGIVPELQRSSSNSGPPVGTV